MRLLLVLAVLLSSMGRAGTQVGSRLWRPEERVVLGSFRTVAAVAASDAGLFAATEQGLIVYDTRSRRWLPPVTTSDGFPDVPVRSALADPADHSVWFGTDRSVVHFLPVLRRVEEIPLGAPADQLAFDAADPFRGLYVRTGGRWWFLPRGAVTAIPDQTPPPPANRIEGLTVRQALAREPAAHALSGLALTDRRLERYRFTSVAEDPLHRVLFFGTNGGGILRYDPATTEFESMPFGLMASSVGAVVATPDGILVGTGRDADRIGFSRIGHDYQFAEWIEGGVSGFGFREVRDLVAWEGGTWAATDAGVLAFGGEVNFLVDALPSTGAYRLVASSSGLWVGTRSGVARLMADGSVTYTHELVTPVSAIAIAFDSLWVGSASGLHAAPLPAPVPEPIVAAPALMSEPVRAIASRNDTVVVAFDDRIAWRTVGDRWQPERAWDAEMGSISAVALDEGLVWIGGDRGLAFYEFATRRLQVVAAATDFPGAIVDIDTAPGLLWVGTTGGVVRFERSALR